MTAASQRLEWLDGEALVFDSREQKLYRADLDFADDFLERSAPATLQKSAPRTGRHSASGDCFHIADVVCGVSFADNEVANAFRLLFGHLEVRSQPCDLRIEVVRTATGYDIKTGEKVVFAVDAVTAALSLKADILDSWLNSNPESMAFHAAALRCGTGATILAGHSGQGKTTLAAMMHARGCELIADDVALLTEGDEGIRGFASAFAVKPASVSVLAARFPELASVPELTRPDGKVVRYLRPRSTTTSAKVNRILFPHFSAGASFEVTSMPRGEALVRLLSEAKNHQQQLSIAGFASICQVLRNSEVAALQYGDADEAAARLTAC